MNDHTLFLAAAYAFALVCMIWEVIALQQRRATALNALRQALEADE